MKNSVFSLCIAGMLFAMASEGASGKNVSKERPNIIFVLADDLGYGDLGCYGQEKIETPHIDQLAKEGIRFTDHYSGQAVCTPSRASLLLGQHMGHCRITGNTGAILTDRDVTVATLLQQAGYKTCMIGKYGLMGKQLKPNTPSSDPKHPGHPNQQGFDHWFGFSSQGYAHFYYPDFLFRNDQKVLYPENQGIRENGYYAPGKGSYAHDLFRDEALGFIKENKDQPFFLYIPFAIPHAEMAVPADDPGLAKYMKLGWPEKKHPEGGGGGAFGSVYTKGYCASDHPNATYAAMITKMDRSIGQIMELLKELKLDDDTLVVFTSDNGASAEGGQNMHFFNSSGPLRGFKRSIYEGGTRVPFIARWPHKIPAGITTDHISGFNDFLVTACDIAGISSASATTDGVSYLPTLLGQEEEQKKEKFRYYHWKNEKAVRAGNWKLIEKNSKKNPAKYELYNLKKDIGETKNLADSMPEVVSRLKPYLKEATEKLNR